MQDKSNKILQTARKLILFFRSQDRIASESEKDELWNRITSNVKKEKRGHLYLRIYRAAAVAATLALLIGTGVCLLRNNTSSTNIRAIASRFESGTVDEKEIILAVSQQEKIQIGDDAKVAYKKDGTVNISSQTITKEITPQEDNYNQLIVPKGKRSELQLSDGTKLWVNAGSRVIYPCQFANGNREIYVEGEIYLEVVHDPSRPFIVKTESFDVEVLGTKFNVNAYKDGEWSEVVLAQGSVRIKDERNKDILLKPDQMARLQKEKAIEVVHVNASEYTCWANGLLLLHATPITTVLNKLRFFYGKTILFDESLKDIPLSGKLDLKENLDDVLRLISGTAPITYEKENDSYIIKRKL